MIFAGYHTFGVDWQADHLAFYIDGIRSGAFPSPGTDNANIPRTPGYIIIQQMVENSWIRSTGELVPDPAASVDTFHVDYVRVWQGTVGNGLRRDPSAPWPGSAQFHLSICVAGPENPKSGAGNRCCSSRPHTTASRHSRFTRI